MRHFDEAGSIASTTRAAVVAAVLVGVAVVGVGGGSHIQSRHLRSAADANVLLCPIGDQECRKSSHPGQR